MSHRSRVCAVLFDVQADSYEAACKFWGGALGRDVKFSPSERYTKLSGELDYLIQKIEPGREGVHIDIEKDDVEAEVTRLKKLGARKRDGPGSERYLADRSDRMGVIQRAPNANFNAFTRITYCLSSTRRAVCW